MSETFHILYLVHDVSDPAVARRKAMLQEGGATVTLAGFRRTQNPLPGVLDLGQTFNGGFAQRIIAVLRTALTLRKHKKLFQTADCIIARNLEMLAIGVRGKSLCKPSPTLVYESLDIHRLLLNQGAIGVALRELEGWLSRRVCALLTSSPAFIHEYFEKRSCVHLPTYLVENKLYPDTAATPIPPRDTAGPWVIGWYGAIRCHKSLEILKALVRESAGSVKVIIRGRPALDQFTNFEAQTADTPGLHFAGPYKNPADLEKIYTEAHFTWAIDMFEEGQNSAWLLPNRIYEGGAFASVPIAAENVETGHFLKRLGVGVHLREPKLESLREYFANLTPATYRALEAASRSLPLSTWVAGKQDCLDLVNTLRTFCKITPIRKVA